MNELVYILLIIITVPVLIHYYDKQYSKFDYYVFAQQWPSALCKEINETHHGKCSLAWVGNIPTLFPWSSRALPALFPRSSHTLPTLFPRKFQISVFQDLHLYKNLGKFLKVSINSLKK